MITACLSELVNDRKLKPEWILSMSVVDIINRASSAGATALHVCALAGAASAALALVTLKADVNARDKRGETPLHHAGRGACFLVFRMLVAAGADERVVNDIKVTPAALLYDKVNG